MILKNIYNYIGALPSSPCPSSSPVFCQYFVALGCSVAHVLFPRHPDGSDRRCKNHTIPVEPGWGPASPSQKHIWSGPCHKWRQRGSRPLPPKWDASTPDRLGRRACMSRQWLRYRHLFHQNIAHISPKKVLLAMRKRIDCNSKKLKCVYFILKSTCFFLN